LLLVVSSLCFALASLARAQCTTTWQSTGGVPGPDATVFSSLQWDPDGPGPLPPQVVLGGDFRLAGDVVASHLVAYEPALRTWSTFGSGLDGSVYALVAMPNGDLIAAGAFQNAGGLPANRIARWNGSAWSPLGAGCDARVFALAVLPNGDLVAGGEFASAGGVPAARLARWNGSNWSAFGDLSGTFFPYVSALAVDGNGHLLVGGQFSTIGGVAAEDVARWDGVAWSALGSGLGGPSSGGSIGALAVGPGGRIVAGGWFQTVPAGGFAGNAVAEWNGNAWVSIGSGVFATVGALAFEPSGALLVGGADHVLRWNGTSWSQVGSGSGFVFTLTVLQSGTIVASGLVVGAPSASTYAQRFDGAAWEPLSVGLDFGAYAVAALPNGDLVAGGAFTKAGGLPTNRIAQRSGGQWLPLGSGLSNGTLNSIVYALAVLPNGDLVAGGQFTSAGGVPASNLARWDGVGWSALGSGTNNVVRALVVMPNGDLIAAGSFTMAGGVPCNLVARWNGTSWSPLGSGLTGTFFLLSADALCVLPNGDLVAAGSFTVAGGVPANGIARWNGSSWSPLGAGVQSVQALAVLPNGQLVAGGAFLQAGGVPANCIARWNGSTWSPLGSGVGSTVNALLPLPDGQLLVAGNFDTAGGQPARRIARWNGSSWSALGAGLGATGAGFGAALAQLPDGTVAVAGTFRTAGALVSSNVALLAPTCPALAVPTGAGCVGAGGANVLAARTLPWLGTTFTAVGTGMPPVGFVVGVYGLGTANVPLSTILLQGQPGCALLVTPDVLDVQLPTAGSVTTQLVLPVAPSLLGQVLHQQLVPVELAANGTIAAFTASNALAVTIGTF
jgi:hypothetical protein